MKALIVYDSAYGNTEKIAQSIGNAITGDIKVLRAGEVIPSDIESIDLLIVGSPTQGFKATKPVQAFIESIPKDVINGVNVIAFDTRMPEKEVGRGLRFIMKVGGYAAPRIAQSLKKKGGNLGTTPEGFFVKDKDGPLLDGELERSANWIKGIVKSNN